MSILLSRDRITFTSILNPNLRRSKETETLTNTASHGEIK